MAEYESKFNELSRLGPESIYMPSKKNEMLIMRKEFHDKMMGQVKEPLLDLVDVVFRY